jgi:Flp pilus assembly protein TadD
MARVILAAIFLWAFTLPNVAATEVIVPLIVGNVFADGRPINRIVEVRLEAYNSALVASAYTLDAPRFTFRNLTLNLEDIQYLVIREAGFKELRYELEREDFIQDSSGLNIYHYGDSIILNLESLPSGDKAKNKGKTGPQMIDAKQLQARISDEARKEYNLALAGSGTGDSKETLMHLERAVELEPEYYDALNKLGAEYLRTAQYRKAEAALERARAINQYDPLPLTNLGILYLEEGEKLAAAAAGEGKAKSEAAEASYRRAVDVFEKAMDLSPLAPRSSFYLGTALYKVGVYERAESLLNTALDFDSQLHEARLTLINIYMQQRRYDATLKQITAYLEANPDSSHAERLKTLKAQIEKTVSQQK